MHEFVPSFSPSFFLSLNVSFAGVCKTNRYVFAVSLWTSPKCLFCSPLLSLYSDISAICSLFLLSWLIGLSYPILSYPILSHNNLSYPTLFYSIIFYPILSYPILFDPILYTAYDSPPTKKSCCLCNENARPDQSQNLNECNHFIRVMGPGSAAPKHFIQGFESGL